eukprot:TRINITY_DN621_c0_g1_i1.p3 TRINITY_DN621_c0_g1~~TRINITY_DN621_c0_g1_i1.p3  ORF type:complete len:138 (+),score=49.41 TRINITY_DN621_c0_g1_i1:664-1077(+)
MNTHAGMWTQPDEWLVSPDAEPMAPPPAANKAQRAGGAGDKRPNGAGRGGAAHPSTGRDGADSHAAANLVTLLDDAAAASRSPRPVPSSPTSALDQLLSPKPTSPAANGGGARASPVSSTAGTNGWRSAVYKDDVLA